MLLADGTLQMRRFLSWTFKRHVGFAPISGDPSRAFVNRKILPEKQRKRQRLGSVRIGVISDTHGLLRPEAVRALRGSALIVHAGDVGAPEVLEALRGIAPVVAVRGNNDHGAWARALRERETVEIDGARLLVVHDLKTLRRTPPDIAGVIAGHSHQPSITRRDGIVFLNPGSAGPRRFTLPISVARLSVGRRHVRARIVVLAIADRAARSR
jgi:putative phosphoesterase